MTQACVLGIQGANLNKYFIFSESMNRLKTINLARPLVKVEVLPFKYNLTYQSILLIQDRQVIAVLNTGSAQIIFQSIFPDYPTTKTAKNAGFLIKWNLNTSTYDISVYI